MDPSTPYHSCCARQVGTRSRRHTQRICCWFAYGKLIAAESTPVLQFDKKNWMWIDSRRKHLNVKIENLELIEPDDPDLIYLVTSNFLPWLFGEVCEFRFEYRAEMCPKRQSRWRHTGYLEKHSLIPDWKEVPELNAVLKARKQRVFVEFCSDCGRMQHQIVDDKPPFRKKNTLYRDEQRANHSRNAALLARLKDFIPAVHFEDRLSYPEHSSSQLLDTKE